MRPADQLPAQVCGGGGGGCRGGAEGPVGRFGGVQAVCGALPLTVAAAVAAAAAAGVLLLGPSLWMLLRCSLRAAMLAASIAPGMGRAVFNLRSSVTMAAHAEAPLSPPARLPPLRRKSRLRKMMPGCWAARRAARARARTKRVRAAGSSACRRRCDMVYGTKHPLLCQQPMASRLCRRPA